MSTPTFATLGAVNHGKSSVVATLAENDQVRITPMPGETVETQRFSLRDLFVFYDTPGFENAHEALEELRPAAHAPDPLAVFRKFLADHRDDPAFEKECRLFEPVVDGAGIIYVVDGSRAVLPLNLAEMEILRLTGRPRMAIINRTGADDHVQDWKRRLGLHFNAVREFNAHHAAFADRIELLETLAHIEQGWQPRLKEAVRLLRAAWDAKLSDCAEIIAAEIIACLRHRESLPLSEDDDPIRRAALGEELRQRFTRALTETEKRAHGEIIALFGHRLVSAGESADGVFADDLFSEETWKLLGLDERQLVTAGAVAGGLVGASADLVTAGHTLLLGTAIGAAVGAGGAFLLGKQRPELSVDVPGGMLPAKLGRFLPSKFRLGGGALAVGPYAALNFPWILLDRAIGAFAYVINRPHARREKVALNALALHAALERHGLTSARWEEAKRKAVERHFAAIRRDKLDQRGRTELRELLRQRLAEVSEKRIPFDDLVRG